MWKSSIVQHFAQHPQPVILLAIAAQSCKCNTSCVSCLLALVMGQNCCCGRVKEAQKPQRCESSIKCVDSSRLSGYIMLQRSLPKTFLCATLNIALTIVVFSIEGQHASVEVSLCKPKDSEDWPEPDIRRNGELEGHGCGMEQLRCVWK